MYNYFSVRLKFVPANAPFYMTGRFNTVRILGATILFWNVKFSTRKYLLTSTYTAWLPRVFVLTGRVSKGSSTRMVVAGWGDNLLSSDIKY